MRRLAAPPLLAAPAAAQDSFLRTPSGDVQCYAGADVEDCGIGGSEVAPPLPRPGDRDLERGGGFAVGDVGPGARACHGGTLRGTGYPVVPYGRSVTTGAIACFSEQAGLRCLNRDGGGFLVSRRDQRVF